MRLEKIRDRQTHNTYEIEIALKEDDTIYGNLYGYHLQDDTGRFNSRVKLWLFGRLIEDTLNQEGKTLDSLIDEVLAKNDIEVDA